MLIASVGKEKENYPRVVVVVVSILVVAPLLQVDFYLALGILGFKARSR